VDFQFLGNDSENIKLPDKCTFAEFNEKDLSDAAVVAVLKDQSKEIQYFLNGRKIVSTDRQSLVRNITISVDKKFVGVDNQNRVLILRIDKELEFSDAQYALAGASASSATKIKIATLAKDEPD
jgi:hypothetical protein